MKSPEKGRFIEIKFIEMKQRFIEIKANRQLSRAKGKSRDELQRDMRKIWEEGWGDGEVLKM